MSKIRLTENELRRLVNESLVELIDEGFLGNVAQAASGYFSQVKDNLMQGAKNDWNNMKNSWNDNMNYRQDKRDTRNHEKNNTDYNTIVNYYGQPCSEMNSGGVKRGLNKPLYVYDMKGDYEYILGMTDFVYPNSTKYIQNRQDYNFQVNNNSLFLSKDPNSQIFKNVTSKFLDMNGNWINGGNKDKLARALKNYRLARTKAWEQVYYQKGNTGNTNNFNV